MRVTLEKFIERSNKKHNFKYDYSKVILVDVRSKVEIICPIHGSFFQVPYSHMDGLGCRLCANHKLSNREEFFESAKKMYNNFYDYSKSIYKNSLTRLEIICPTHGSFTQLPETHLKGNGCPSCFRNSPQHSLGQFIEKANKKHNNRYDYSKVIYEYNDVKVEIICPVHGSFFQTPSSHMRGTGCTKCFRDSQWHTQELFIEKANKKHNNFYDYSKAVYKGDESKVEIICPIHGSFFQKVTTHLQGAGCATCFRKSVTHTVEMFIEKANKKHNNFYDYSRTIYVRNKDKLEVICPIHGSFWQRADQHLGGKGCPNCRSSKGEKLVSSWLTSNNLEFKREYTFEDCVDKGKLPFDFCVFIENKRILIEYDGAHHYIPVDFYGGEKHLEYTKRHDDIKNEYVKNNNIPLLRIKYPLNTDRINYELSQYFSEYLLNKKEEIL
jgi:hypothetical protein